MRALLIIGFLTASLLIQAQEESLQSVRKAFHQAVIDEQASEAYHQLFEALDERTPTIEAYQAVSEAMLARVLWNPFSKLGQVRKYQQQIEAAVAADPSNIEIRFLRLAIEYNLPPFLGMSEHIDEDVSLILQNLSSVSSINLDPSYGQYIFYFLESTELCTSDQILAMRETLNGSHTF